MTYSSNSVFICLSRLENQIFNTNKRKERIRIIEVHTKDLLYIADM